MSLFVETVLHCIRIIRFVYHCADLVVVVSKVGSKLGTKYNIYS